MARVAINGFGRIGRQSFKALLERYADDLEIVAVNDLTDNETLAHLLRHDSTYGPLDGEVSVTEDQITVDFYSEDDDEEHRVEMAALAEKDPSKLPWRDMGIDIVISHHRQVRMPQLLQQRRLLLEQPAILLDLCRRRVLLRAHLLERPDRAVGQALRSIDRAHPAAPDQAQNFICAAHSLDNCIGSEQLGYCDHVIPRCRSQVARQNIRRREA